jgi:hypothetical protein
MEAIGSALGSPGGGGLVIAIIYIVLGPDAVAYHSFRLARHAYTRRTRRQATLSPSGFRNRKKVSSVECRYQLVAGHSGGLECVSLISAVIQSERSPD